MPISKRMTRLVAIYFGLAGLVAVVFFQTAHFNFVNYDDGSYVFDNQMLAQIIWLGHPVGEITCPAKYMPEASSINFQRSVRYGLGCLKVGIEFVIARWRGAGTIFEGLTRPV